MNYKIHTRFSRIGFSALALALSFALVNQVLAEEITPMDELAFAIDNLTMFVSAVLVLFMQAGFALVEAGFNSSKNTINILFKNVMDMCVGAVLYFLVGLHVLVSIAMLGLVLLHSGKGGGLSDMFGGGMGAAAQGSTVVEKNLDRLTVVAAVIFTFTTLGLGLLMSTPT